MTRTSAPGRPRFSAQVGDSRLLSHEDGIRLLKAAQAVHPESFELPYCIGYRSLQMTPSRVGESVAYFRIAVSADPESPYGWLSLGECT